MGIIEGGWLPPGRYRDLTVVGNKKSVASNLSEQTVILHNIHMELQNGKLKAVNEGSSYVDVEFEEPLKLELKDFVESIKTGKKPLAEGQAGLNAIKIAEKALKSARLGRRVKINEVE